MLHLTRDSGANSNKLVFMHRLKSGRPGAWSCMHRTRITRHCKNKGPRSRRVCRGLHTSAVLAKRTKMNYQLAGNLGARFELCYGRPLKPLPLSSRGSSIEKSVYS